MKSFTRNQHNPSLQMGLDKRFEALVKKEMMEHQHLISSHNKEMQDLRDSLKISTERFDSLYERSETDLKDLALNLNQQVIFLREKLASNESKIAEQKQAIDSLHREMNEFHESHASKRTLEKMKGDFDIAIKENTTSHLNSFQEFQRELKFSIQSLQNDLIKLRTDTAQIIDELDNKVDRNLSISRIDKDGVLKEVRIYERTIFIIEKKIENIYTLIERINKRGEVCHKPE